MKGCKARLAKTKDLPFPNIYAQALMGEFSHRAFDEDKAPSFKSQWRSKVFEKPEDYALDVEIGTGNGYHFAHRSSKNLDRALIGLEVKYKPLIQAIRRALNAGAKENAYILRYNARDLKDLFAKGEMNNLYIHHPDPWPRKKHWKHRLIQKDFLDEVFELMRTGSFIEFKTDNEDYFNWSEDFFKNSKFEMDFYTRDLHNSEQAKDNFITHFEKIFLAKGQPIFYLRVKKSS